MQPQNERPTRVQILREKLDEAIPYDLRPLWREFQIALDAEGVGSREACAGDEERPRIADQEEQDGGASANGARCK